MPVVFARVELRGKPTEEIYEKLHAFMKQKNWFQHLPQNKDTPMPHAMYQGSFTQRPDLAATAKVLKDGIQTTIWTKAIVLLIEEANWAQI